MHRHLLILFLWVTVGACAPKSRAMEKPVVDIDGLIDRQLALLTGRKPVLNKVAGIHDRASDTTYVPDKEAWRSELEIYRSLGMLNQRIYEGTYKTEGPLDDPLSNLLIRQYANDEAPLKLLRVYYLEKPDRIRQVEGEVEESTPLLTSSRRLTMWFEDDRGSLLLTRYQLTGYQKAALRDTVRFQIQGAIKW